VEGQPGPHRHTRKKGIPLRTCQGSESSCRGVTEGWAQGLSNTNPDYKGLVLCVKGKDRQITKCIDFSNVYGIEYKLENGIDKKRRFTGGNRE